MDYKIIEKEAFDIIENVEVHTVEDSENAKSIPNFWTKSHNDGTVKKLLDTTTDRTYIFGVRYGNLPENAKTFDYSIAAKCNENTVVPDGFRKKPFLQELGQYLSVKVQRLTLCKICAQDCFWVLSYIGLSAYL